MNLKNLVGKMRRILIIAFGVFILLSGLSLSAESKYYYKSFNGFRLTYPEYITLDGDVYYSGGGVYRDESNKSKTTFILSYSNGYNECRMKVYTDSDANAITELLLLIGDLSDVESGDLLEFILALFMGETNTSPLFSGVENGAKGNAPSYAYQDYTAWYHGGYRTGSTIPMKAVYCREYIKKIRNAYVCFSMIAPDEGGVLALQKIANTLVATN